MMEVLGVNSSTYTDGIPHFSWITFITSILVAILTSFIVPMYIKPYFDTKTVFKQHLIETWAHIMFFSNIYTNYFKKDDVTRLEFFEEVLMAKDELRKCWVDLEASYYLIPKYYKGYLTKRKLIPELKELHKIFGDMRKISNSIIIYTTEVAYKNRDEDRKDRVDAINRINCFICRYTEIEYTEVK